jgi:pimeloyl-ACP methyl ester carboxylesterase
MSGRAAMKHAIEIGWRWDALCCSIRPTCRRRAIPIRAMRVFENKLTEWALGRRPPLRIGRRARERISAARAPRRLGCGRARIDGALGAAQGTATVMPSSVRPRTRPASMPRRSRSICGRAPASSAGPVKLIGADPNLKGGPATGPTNHALGTENGYNYCYVEGTGHLLQIEKPAECARLVEEFVKECGLR